MLATVLLVLFTVSADDASRFFAELRTERWRSNGTIEYELVHYAKNGSTQRRAGEYRFCDGDSVWSELDPEDASKLVFMPVPKIVRSKIGPYQVHSHGHSMNARVSSNGDDFGIPIQEWNQIGIFPTLEVIQQGERSYLTQLTEGTDSGFAVEARGLEGDLVTTRLVAGDRSLVFWQDPTQGNQVVRSQMWSKDELVQECRVELSRTGERSWFPKSINYFRKRSGQDDLALATSIVIPKASFDNDDAPPLAMSDAGVCVGTNIVFVEDRGVPPQQMFSWDGFAVVPMKDVDRRIREGQLELGEQFRRDTAAMNLARDFGEMQRRVSGATDATMSQWRQYTLAFAERNEFDEEQRQKALLFCQRCEDKAARELDKMLVVLQKTELRKSAIEAVMRQDPLPNDIKAKVTDIKQANSVVARIFNEELKPKLDSLLTREQRKNRREP